MLRYVSSVHKRGKHVICAPTLLQNTDIFGRNSSVQTGPCFVSQTCHWRDWDLESTTLARSAGAENPAWRALSCHCSRRSGAFQGFHRPRRGLEELHCLDSIL